MEACNETVRTSPPCRGRLQAGTFRNDQCRQPADRLLRGPCRKLYGRRRSAACPAWQAAPGLCLVRPWRRSFHRLDAAARRRSSCPPQDRLRPLRAREFFGAPRLVEPRHHLSQRSAAPALYRGDAGSGLRPYRSGSDAARPADAARESGYLSALRGEHHRGDGVSGRGRTPHRLRPAARRQQCFRRRHQPPHGSARLSQTLPGAMGARDPSERPFGDSRRCRCAALDRQPRYPGEGSRLGALRGAHRPNRADRQPGRMGQRRAGMAGFESRGRSCRGHFETRRRTPGGLRRGSCLSRRKANSPQPSSIPARPCQRGWRRGMALGLNGASASIATMSPSA
ncbi:hypothetical protein RHSP_76861 [Rhizobium freirei PRF 81]|uniref:Uncharacterized protein n=1 Tax=Rhizobium freirei PRF 81 TaxID=363754 RepID=N6TUU6_9HYPH|nr:hypothetical protein RHSP_76861 [Rhizobium freirei PRF 81]